MRDPYQPVKRAEETIRPVPRVRHVREALVRLLARVGVTVVKTEAVDDEETEEVTEGDCGRGGRGSR